MPLCVCFVVCNTNTYTNPIWSHQFYNREHNTHPNNCCKFSAANHADSLQLQHEPPSPHSYSKQCMLSQQQALSTQLVEVSPGVADEDGMAESAAHEGWAGRLPLSVAEGTRGV